MRVAHDRHIPGVRAALPAGIDLLPFDPAQDLRSGLLRRILDSDALLIRTVSRITPETFPELGSPGRRLSFIGTATAGIDHVDAAWLDSLGIRFASAPGCNAMAVGEYVATALLAWLDHDGPSRGQAGADLKRRPPIDPPWSKEQIQDMAIRVGILGVGHAGGAAARLLSDMGFDVRCFDPPRMRRDPSFRSCDWSDIADCDVMSLHVPLVRTGAEATQGWITSELLAGTRVRLVIQASRGGVLVESDAADLVCDVWQREPAFSDQTARHAFLATPHIAGYSIEGKRRATRAVCDALIRHAGIDAPHRDPSAPPDALADDPIVTPSGSAPVPGTLTAAMKRLHPMWTYDEALRSCIGRQDPDKAACFHSIRDTFPHRREYGSMRVPVEWMMRYPILEQLGVGTIAQAPEG